MAAEVVVDVAAAAAGSGATYPAGARPGGAGTERIEPEPGPGPGPAPEPGAELGGWPLSPCARRRLCCRASLRRPPAPREGARGRLHPPPPAPQLSLLLSASIPATCQLCGSSGAGKEASGTRSQGSSTGPGLRDSSPERSEGLRSPPFRCSHSGMPTSPPERGSS